MATMTTTTTKSVVLEAASQSIVEATAQPPLLYELPVAQARKVLDDIQAEPVEMVDVDDEWVTVPADVGDVPVRIVRPVGATRALPAVLYMHGGGWILGNAGTHDRLVRELAVGVGAAIVFVEYTRSPEAHYPVAIEQGYAVAQWLQSEGASHGIDPSRVAVAGDSVGGNMTAALALMAKERGDVSFVHHSMYYPVTDAAMDTDSYEQFATGHYLAAKEMAWFRDAYLPDADRRSEITASPYRATPEQLMGLPPAFLLVDEADVLRDEGEGYAAHLRAAGVDVTTVHYDGITHDFMMLNPLRDTPAAQVMLGLGLVCWAIMGSMILGRLIFRPPLPDALAPTMAIEVAPAAVASLAHFFANGGQVDFFAAILAGYGLLMVTAQLPLLPRYLRLSFSLGTWAFTFSWTAVAGAALFWIASSRFVGDRALSYLVLIAITALVGGIAARTLLAARQGRLLAAVAASEPALGVGSSRTP